MPRYSKKKQFLRDYKRAIDARLSSAEFLKRCGIERPSGSKVLDIAYVNRYKVMNAKRYLFRGCYRRRNTRHLHALLYDDQEYNADEFQADFRMSRKAFFEVLDLIKQHSKSHATAPFLMITTFSMSMSRSLG